MTRIALSPIQVHELALQSVHFERSSGPILSESEELTYNLNLELEVGFNEDDPHEALVKVAIAVDWSEDTPPFELSIGYLALVTQDGSIPHESFDKVCQTRVSVMILGMLRPFVSRLMSEAGESFRLPLLDLRNLTPKADSADS